MSRPNLVLATRDAKRGAFIYDDARVGGLMIFAPSGWGKSRLLGRAICHQDALRGVGTVVLDVLGATVDNALDRMLYLPKPLQLTLLERCRYLDMGGQKLPNGETVVPAWPILAKRFSDEDLYTTSQRLVDLIAQTDKKFADATIQGLKRTEPILTAVGSVLAALDLPINRAFDLLRSPEKWRGSIAEAARRNPQAKGAAAELAAYTALSPREREVRSEPLLNRLSILRFDEVSRAMFCTTQDPTIDWEEVASKGLQVYIDLRSKQGGLRARELKLFWVWNSLMEYVRSRESAGREYPPLSVVIDELSFFVRGPQLNTEAISWELEEFIDNRMRNANIWLSCATQDMKQLPEPLLASCLRMKSHLYGALTDYASALDRARRWFRKNPHLVKDVHRVWGTNIYGGAGMPMRNEHVVIDTQNVYYPLEEQDYLNSRKFTELEKGEWFFAAATKEGEIPKTLTKITTNKLDATLFIRPENRALITRLRQYLMGREGIPVAEVLRELEIHSPEQGGIPEQQPAVPADRDSAHTNEAFFGWETWQKKAEPEA